VIGTLALSTLRSRKAGFIGAFLALLCAAAMVAACGVLLETGLRGRLAPERYAGAPIIVAADQYQHWVKHKKDKTKDKAKSLTERAWLDESIAGRLRPLAGVAAVVPEVTFRAVAFDDHGRPLTGGRPSWGHAWASAPLTPYVLAAGRPPRAPGEIVLDAAAGARAGDQVTVQTTAGPARYRVVGVTKGRLGGQASVFFSAGEARRLAGHDGKVTALGLLPKPGTGTLTRAVRGALAGTSAHVYTGDERGALEFRDADQARLRLISMGGALGGTCLLVAILVVVGTFALSIQQRLREIAVLRAVAATPRQIRALLGREALIVGTLAAVPGAVAGLGIAAWLRARFVALGAMPERLGLVLSPLPVIAAVVATVAAAWIAARVSGRRAARIRPVQALADAAIEPSRPALPRIVAGLVALAGHIVLTVVLGGLHSDAAASPVTFLSVVLAAVAFALLGPLVVRVAATLLTAPLRLSPAAGYLAAANLRTSARRFASVVTPAALAVGMTGTILFTQTTVGHAAQRQVDAGTHAAYALTGSPGVAATTADAARRVPGVRVATEITRTRLRVGQDKYPAQGVTPGNLTTTLDLGVRAGSLTALTDGTVALSTTAARHRGARIGDPVPITLGDGVAVTPRLVAIYDRGLGFGDVTLPHDLVAAHVDDPLATTVLIDATPAARAGLTALTRDHPGLRLLDAGALRAQQRAQQQNAAQLNYVAMALIIAFTAIALVNTLAMATGDRTGELTLLRLVGTTRRQLLLMLRLETLAAVLIGVLLGTAVAVSTLSAYAGGMTGTPLPYAPPLAYLAIVAAVTALALTATTLPARLALRPPPNGGPRAAPA
jgi:putative ABC transport system permease protein